MDKKSLSPFASMLRKLLDETGVLRRTDWAEILGVSEAAISQWVNDSVIPKAENLRAIYTTLIADRRVPEQVLEEFDAFARKPANEVSPHGERMLPTIGHYMVRPVRDGFLRTLETLAPHFQEKALLEAAARVRELRRTPPSELSVAERRRASFEDLIAAAVEQTPRHDSLHKEVVAQGTITRWRGLQAMLVRISQARYEFATLRATSVHSAPATDIQHLRTESPPSPLLTVLMEAKASGREVEHS